MVGLLLYARVGVAQPAAAPPSTPDDAQTAFDTGRKLLAAHRPAEACAKFVRALQIEPGNVGVLLNLGLCHEQLDQRATAIDWFRKARARASELQLAGSIRAAQDKLAALTRGVATVRIALSPPDVAAAITVDGAPIAAADLGRVELDAGHHVIEARSRDRFTRAEVDTIDGTATEIALVVPQPAAPSPAPAAAPNEIFARSPTMDTPRTQRHRAYLAGAIGGSLVIGSAALGLVGRSAVRSTDHPDAQRDWTAAVAYGGTSLFVLGAAAIGWGIWTYVHAGEPAGRTSVAPAVGDRSIGIEARGAF